MSLGCLYEVSMVFQGSFKDVLRKVQKLYREITGNSQGRLKKVKKNVFQKIFGPTIFLTNLMGQKNSWSKNLLGPKYFCQKIIFWIMKYIVSKNFLPGIFLTQKICQKKFLNQKFFGTNSFLTFFKHPCQFPEISLNNF